MYFKKIISLSLFSVLTVNAFAQVPVLVKDINTAGNGNPQKITNVNGTLFFVGNTAANGNELWKSDGTELGTTMVKDINPGTANPSIGKITSYNGKVYFRAFNPTDGYELWKSDGTEAGTVILKEFAAGNGNIDPSNIIEFNGSLYFTERSSTAGVNLWKSDGTEAGTVLLQNLYTSGNASNATYFAVMNNTLFFIASENALFSSDIWKTDGTANGTSLLLTMSGQTGELIVVGTKLFFGYAGEGGAGTGKGLYVSDGLVNGTYRIKELNLTNMINFPSNGTAISFKNELIFTAYDAVNGEELWKSDGTEAGTVLVKDVRAGMENGFDALPFLTKGTANEFYFISADENGNRELWVSDGSTAGTSLLDTPNAGSISPANLYAYNGYLFYRARSSVFATGDELWRTDGTRAGTKMLVDFWQGINSSSPSNFCGANNTLYFNANNGTVGTELYALAVTPVGTGVSEEHLSELRVYPNPAKHVVWVAKSGEQGERSLEHGAGSRAVQFEMFDVNGRMVLRGELLEGSVDVSGLEAGVYVLRVCDAVARVMVTSD